MSIEKVVSIGLAGNELSKTSDLDGQLCLGEILRLEHLKT